MKKLIYLIVAIVALSCIIAGCGIPMVPPAEQSKATSTVWHVPGDFSTIQDAVDNASDGDIIYVHEGIYNECILIDGVDLSLIAVGDVIIVAPVLVCPGHGDTIQIYNSTCTIDGFRVEGGKGGIYARGMSELGETEVDVTIRNNTVVEYLKNGITVNGELAVGQIYNNTVCGGGPLGVQHYAQNGIQIGYGATGTILRNTVTGNWYTGDDWSACGILIFEADDVTVQGNSVNTSQTGIAIEAWGWYFPSANKNKITRNIINDANWGISVAAYAWDYTYSDVLANNNKVVNNTIEAVNGDTGVYVGTWVDDGITFLATADNNKIIHNQISGYEDDIVNEGIASKVHANVVE